MPSDDRALLPPGPRVSFVLATINERDNLEELFARLERDAPADREVIVADDGSTDGTRELLASREASDPRVRSLLHDGPQTTAFAHLAALRVARGRYVVVMDADLQHPTSTIAPLLAGLEGGADVVVASRYLPGGATGERDAYRGLISRIGSFLASTALANARGLSDPMSGYFAFRREAVRPPPPGLRGYKVLLILLASSPPLKVREVPFVFQTRRRGSSKVVQGAGFVRIYLHELLQARRLEARARRADPARGGEGGGRAPSTSA